MTRLAARDVHLTDWRWQLGTLRADFATRSLAQATAFLTDVSPLLDGEATVPVVQVNRDRVLITLKDPSEGVTRREAELAERISELAAQHGLSAKPDRLQVLELALDAPNEAKVRPFWAALLGLVDTGDDVTTPPARCRPCGFSRPTRPPPTVSAFTSTSRCLVIRRRPASTPRFRRAAASSTATSSRRSPCWPTPTATWPASAPNWAASSPTRRGRSRG